MENKKERRIYGHSSPAYCVEAGVSCPAAPMKSASLREALRIYENKRSLFFMPL